MVGTREPISVLWAGSLALIGVPFTRRKLREPSCVQLKMLPVDKAAMVPSVTIVPVILLAITAPRANSARCAAPRRCSYTVSRRLASCPIFCC
jgi:hypothetical protein